MAKREVRGCLSEKLRIHAGTAGGSGGVFYLLQW